MRPARHLTRHVTRHGVGGARPAVAMMAAVGLAACAGGGDGEPDVLVLAAASLTDAFRELEAAFEADHDVDLELSFAGSSSIRLQIEEGAPADVVALANEDLIESLVDDGVASEPVVIATNRLVIAVPADDPRPVRSVADFTDESLLLGVCAPQVPCGSYAAEVFDRAGVTPALDTRASDVRTLAAQVARGELDAALVYATDAAALADDVDTIELPDDVSVVARYPIALIDDDAASRAFVDFVTSPDGRAILVDAGFGVP